jgi:hypothetical protein
MTSITKLDTAKKYSELSTKLMCSRTFYSGFHLFRTFKNQQHIKLGGGERTENKTGNVRINLT